MKTKSSRWLTGLYCTSVLSLVVVASSPWSRWVVVSHTHRDYFYDGDAYTGRQPNSDDPDETGYSAADFEKACTALDNAAPRHADDAGIQLAYALRRMDEVDDHKRCAESANRIRPLLTRFPDNPLVLAAWCRFRSAAILPGKDGPVASAPAIAEFGGIAAQGERIDPRNAYFTSMRTIGLIAGGRRNEALAALHEAAGKPVWEDYSVGEAEGAVRLMEAASRVGDPFVWTTESMYVEFPHLGPLRSAAISLRDLAVEQEKAGRVEAGVRVRHDLILLGGKMRSQSHASMSSRAGISIERIATSHPGGAPDLIRAEGQTDEGLLKSRHDRYAAFLARSGVPPEEAKWVREQGAADEQADSIIRDGTEKVDSFSDALFFVYPWALSLAVSRAILGILLLYAAASALARLPFVRELKPLPAQGRWGFWIGVIAFAVGKGLRHLGTPRGTIISVMVVMCAIAILIGLSRRRAALWQGVIVVAVVFAALIWLPKGMLNVGLIFLLFSVPSGRRSKEPLVASMIRAIRRMASPTIALGVLLYSGLVYNAGIHYRIARVDLPRVVRDENRFYAEALGRRWPE